LQGQDNKKSIYFLSTLRERRLISKPFISFIFNFILLVFIIDLKERLYMKRKKFLNGLIIFAILFFVFMAISPATNAQIPYFGPYGPYFTPPLAYNYAFNPFIPAFPSPFLAPYRNAAVKTAVLPLTTTAPAVTPAGLSITSLIAPPPIGTITFSFPIAPLATPATVIFPSSIAPTLIAPTLIAPTFINPTLLAAPLAATVVPGLSTAILNAFSPSSGGNWALLASLGILI